MTEDGKCRCNSQTQCIFNGCPLEKINLLRDEIEDMVKDTIELNEECEQLKAERDEARREVCHLCYLHIDGDPVAKTQESVAKHRGWDCFEEQGDE